MIISQRGEGIFHCGSLQHPCKLLIYYLLLPFKYSSSSCLWNGSYAPVWGMGGTWVGGQGTSQDQAVGCSLTCGCRVMDRDRREETIRGKMTSHGQNAGDLGGELCQGEVGTVGPRADAGCGHRDVCPWRLGGDKQSHVQSPHAESLREGGRKKRDAMQRSYQNGGEVNFTNVF